ncbi:8-hydroxygeraniol dehydrogenase-like [Salvia hispanica]|uniref:8-hydroxygeraniol dehydrogenase-like n=1 Tax=Salvia hispanica TaxID=49212 RepID=UPI0020090517|nr:8-hydroxygeraniol dehydrogenase-like [Salvia hispanica]
MSKSVNAIGWAARDPSGVLSPFKFSRPAAAARDVHFKVLYCGICHSDLHTVRNEWGNTRYPVVPGHEIVGVVTAVGPSVTKFSPGDKVGAGCLVNSCRSCDQCAANLENYCPDLVLTYNSLLPGSAFVTYGGYSDVMAADEDFLVRWPDSLPMDKGAPLLCAGITTYSPLRYFELDQPGQKLGVVGLGGLGHVAVKLAKAFGLRVTVVSTSSGKRDEALGRLGADAFLVSGDAAGMAAAAGTLDGIIDTVSAQHALPPLLGLLKPHGKLILVGAPEKPLELAAFPLIMGRKTVAGSMIGGIRETQEMIDFAAEHGIVADVEVIPIDYVNAAMERLARADVKYRFVIDVGNTLKAE